MTMVVLVSMKSKDPSTHIGAVVVDDDNSVRTIGYNGLPRGANDNIPERNEKPLKYYYYEHAERNAVYNAALMGISLKGCRMYTNGIPCADCARAVIQSGIKEVIVHSNWEDNKPSNWVESCAIGGDLLKECGVKINICNKPTITEIKGLRHGDEVDYI